MPKESLRFDRRWNETGLGIHGELPIVRELRFASLSYSLDQPQPCAGLINRRCRQPDFAVDLAAHKSQAGSFVEAREQAYTESYLHRVNRYQLEPHQLELRLADPGGDAEVAHVAAFACARLRVTAWRQGERDGRMVVNHLAAEHPNLVNPENVGHHLTGLLLGLLLQAPLSRPLLVRVILQSPRV